MNINDFIEVELTQDGLRIFNDRDFIAKGEWARLDGNHLRAQMRVVFIIFGDHMHQTSSQVFVDNQVNIFNQ